MEIQDTVSSPARATLAFPPGTLLAPSAEEPASAVENGALLEEGRTLFIDRRGYEARVEGRAIRLTSREFKLLLFLFERRGEAVSRDDVLAKVWGAEYHGGRRTVDVHVRRLRAKLGDSFQLETLRGVGYKLRSAGVELG